MLVNVPCDLRIENSTIVGERNAVAVRGGTATIINSTLSRPYEAEGITESTIYMDTAWLTGNAMPLATLLVGNRSNAYQYPSDVTLENCTITSSAAGAKTVYIYGNATEENGATLTYDAATVIAPADETVDPVIVGGGKVTVNGSEYRIAADEAALKDAFANIAEGGTIVLQSDFSVTRGENRPGGTPDTYLNTPNVVFDLNGHTITVNSPDYFALSPDGITIRNGTIKIGKEGNAYCLTVTGYAKNVSIEDITIIGGLEITGNGTEATLRNATVYGPVSNNRYSLYLAGGAKLTVENSQFIADDMNVSYMYLATANDLVILNSATFDDEALPLLGSASRGQVQDNRQ